MISLGLAIFKVCEIYRTCQINFLNEYEYGRGWLLAHTHGKAVLLDVPKELLFSFLSGSKSAESLSELCLLISLASTKLSPLLACSTSL